MPTCGLTVDVEVFKDVDESNENVEALFEAMITGSGLREGGPEPYDAHMGACNHKYPPDKLRCKETKCQDSSSWKRISAHMSEVKMWHLKKQQGN